MMLVLSMAFAMAQVVCASVWPSVIAVDAEASNTVGRQLTFLPAGSGTELSCSNGDCQSMTTVAARGDYLYTAWNSQGREISYNVTQTSGTGGFFSFVTDSVGFTRWQSGSSNVSSYSAVSCEVRENGQPTNFGPFRTCTLPAGGAGLTDPTATLPFYLLVQATAPESVISIDLQVAEPNGAAQAAVGLGAATAALLGVLSFVAGVRQN